MRLRALVALLVLLSSMPLVMRAADDLPVIDIAALEKTSLVHQAEFLRAAPDATFLDVRDRPFEPLTPAAVNRGITADAYWLRVRLRNSDPDHPRQWVIRHETSYLDSLSVYQVDETGHVDIARLSDREPFHDRPVKNRHLTHTGTTAAGATTNLYIRLANERADSLSLGVDLWEGNTFGDQVQQENLVLGGYFGAMLVLSIFALIVAALLRQMTYLQYAAFLLISTLMWAMLNGFAYQYLWPDSVFMHNEGLHIVYLLVAISALQFSKHFLQTRRLMPRAHHLLTLLQVLLLGGIGLRLLGLYVEVLYLSYAALVALVLLPLLTWQAYRQGLHYVRWYAAAWVVYGLGLTLSVVSAGTDAFSWGMAPLGWAQGASLLEAVLLMVALGERLATWETDRRKALELANQDDLTGLGNRRVLQQAFELLSQPHSGNGESSFLLLIDLDRFKDINDRHGHGAGDLVLREMARLLRRRCRDTDTCIRYGGEEFLLLFRAPRLQEAVGIAERIRREFGDMVTRFEGAWIRHTLSGGLAAVADRDMRLGLDEVLGRADVALYQAKANGRNRIMVFDAGHGPMTVDEACST